MKSNLCHPASTASWDPQLANPQITVAVADAKDREDIYRIRHQIYGLELGQHATNGEERLRDALDDSNVYLVGKIDDSVVGFISITPPTAPSYSIDKYFARASLPIRFDDKLYEIRLLTVLRKHRGRELATLLMYAAFRWVESHGGTHVAAIGRREILDLYLR
ncbi:MAG TPA: GNAT family N-acetyltransferase, partial [Candidatus Binatia bacterium]|nr:GNAT family N-acetyltransferase [Candidatus Binatia bacterium]